ncbi:MAG: hypothetical protein ACTHKJ_01910 [Candidatus Nitrosocosmicus sp.]
MEDDTTRPHLNGFDIAEEIEKFLLSCHLDSDISYDLYPFGV